ncbi:ATP-binding cassette domain-containing protein [Enterococcus termitis]
MLVQIQNIKKNYGGVPLFDSLDLQIDAGEKISMIGLNGSGKSTLLNVITGLETVDSGTVSRKK